MRSLRYASALTVAITLLLCTIAYALTFPALTGRVVDEAGVLDETTRKALSDKLAAVEAKSGDQIVVVTLRSLQGTSIEDYGYQLGRHWGIGEKGRNNGALLIVAPTERKVRIEVGYGLEGALTDAVSRLIIANAILPRFRANDFAGGITRGVDDIVQVVSGDAEEFKRRAAQRPDDAPQSIDFVTIVLVLIVLFFIFRMSTGSSMPRGRSGRGYSGPIFIPSGSDWSSRSSGNWDSGGGGISGGGGSFGGGGSSGSW